MAEQTLRECRILVVEDEFMLADELRGELADAGALVIGPVGSVAEAIELIAGEQRIDGALLDVNLAGDWVFPAADLLVERSVPFLFTTGYDASVIPSRFEQIMRCEKPVSIRRLTHAIGQIVRPG